MCQLAFCGKIQDSDRLSKDDAAPGPKCAAEGRCTELPGIYCYWRHSLGIAAVDIGMFVGREVAGGAWRIRSRPIWDGC